MSNSTALVQSPWNYCNILRDDRLSSGNYLGQSTFLLFLKMADERSKPPFNTVSSMVQRARIEAEAPQRLSVAKELDALVSASLRRATRLRRRIPKKASTGNLA